MTSERHLHGLSAARLRASVVARRSRPPSAAPSSRPWTSTTTSAGGIAGTGRCRRCPTSWHMDEVGVGTIVNLDGCWEAELEANLERYDRAFPGRFLTFCRVDWSQSCESRTTGASSVRRVGAGLRGSWRRRHQALEGHRAARIRDRDGDLVLLDDPRARAAVGGAGRDAAARCSCTPRTPAAFFRPVDARNERLGAASREAGLAVLTAMSFPSLGRLLGALETVVSRHRDVTFIGAHVGCFVEDLQWVDRMLSSYPNFNVDIAARVGDLGRQPRAAARSDAAAPGPGLARIPMLSRPAARTTGCTSGSSATDDEYFCATPMKSPPGDGRWRVYGLDLPDDVLRRVVGDNARDLIPRLATTGAWPGARLLRGFRSRPSRRGVGARHHPTGCADSSAQVLRDASAVSRLTGWRAPYDYVDGTAPPTLGFVRPGDTRSKSRTDGLMTSSSPGADIPLSSYRPRARLSLPENPVDVARSPRSTRTAIWAAGSVRGRTARASGSCRMSRPWLDRWPRTTCTASSASTVDRGEELSANLEHFDEAHPGRIATFCHVDWSLLEQNSPRHGARRESGRLHRGRRCRREGVEGPRAARARRPWRAGDAGRRATVRGLADGR